MEKVKRLLFYKKQIFQYFGIQNSKIVCILLTKKFQVTSNEGSTFYPAVSSFFMHFYINFLFTGNFPHISFCKAGTFRFQFHNKYYKLYIIVSNTTLIFKDVIFVLNDSRIVTYMTDII